MSRLPIPLGNWGVIRTKRMTPHSWRARAYYRDMDGALRLVEARGPSSTAAQRNIQVKLKERQTPRYGVVSAKDRVNTLIDVFLGDQNASCSRLSDRRAARLTLASVHPDIDGKTFLRAGARHGGNPVSPDIKAPQPRGHHPLEVNHLAPQGPATMGDCFCTLDTS